MEVEVDRDLDHLLPPKQSIPKHNNPRRPANKSTTLFSKVKRRVEYKITQRAYEKYKSNPAKNFNADSLDLEELEPFWRKLFETPSFSDNRLIKPKRPIQPQLLLEPITLDELTKCLKGSKGAPGPDSVTWNTLRNVKHKILDRFNLWLLLGYVPARLCKGYTTLIPKDLDNTKDPTKYRPLTVASTVIRTKTYFVAL